VAKNDEVPTSLGGRHTPPPPFRAQRAAQRRRSRRAAGGDAPQPDATRHAVMTDEKQHWGSRVLMLAEENFDSDSRTSSSDMNGLDPDGDCKLGAVVYTSQRGAGNRGNDRGPTKSRVTSWSSDIYQTASLQLHLDVTLLCQPPRL